jgi:hypothetical protein
MQQTTAVIDAIFRGVDWQPSPEFRARTEQAIEQLLGRIENDLSAFLAEQGVNGTVVERALIVAGIIPDPASPVPPVNVHPLPPRGMAAQSPTYRTSGVLADDDPLLSAVDAIESAATQLHGAAVMLRRLAP